MTSHSTQQDLVEQYLAALRTQLLSVPLSARDEFISEIAEHIAEGRAVLHAEDTEGLHQLLARLGPPAELATEFSETEQEEKREMNLASRARRLIRPALALLVVGLIIGCLVWWTHYQPLKTSPGMLAGPSITAPDGSPLPQVGTANTLPSNIIPVWNMPKGTSTVHVIVSIENAGSLPLRITGVQSPVQGWPAFGPVRVGYGRNVGGPTRPFQPFAVGGNQTWEVSLALPMHCTASPGQAMEASRVLVSTSFFGVSHQVWVNIMPFDVVYAKTC